MNKNWSVRAAFFQFAYVLGLLLVTRAPANAQNAVRRDPICGPEILTVADAWIKSQEEFRALQGAAAGNNLPGASRSSATIRAHLGFMRARTALFAAEQKQQLEQAVTNAYVYLDSFAAACAAGDGQRARQGVPLLKNALAAVGALYPPEALDPSSPKALVMSGLPAPSVSIEIVDAAIQTHQPTKVRFRLRSGNGKPVTPGNLILHQEHLLHALLLDPAFRDYHHEHPTITAIPGEYEFSFTPRENSNYRLWINLVTMPFALEEFPYVDLLTAPGLPRPDRMTNTVAITEAGRTELIWVTGSPIAERKSRLRVRFFDREGQPRQDLEKFMGAFAHLVGFSEDYRSLIHIHPLDEPAPSTPSGQNGGPDLDFVFIVPKRGYMRLFVQTQLAQKTAVFGFGFDVQSAP